MLDMRPSGLQVRLNPAWRSNGGPSLDPPLLGCVIKSGLRWISRDKDTAVLPDVHGAYLVQLVVQLRKGGSDQLLPERCCCLPVEVDVGHGVDGVVAESPQVIGVGVGVVVVVMLASGGRVQAGFAHHSVPVLDPLSRRCVRGGRGPRCARIREVYHPESALGLFAIGGSGSARFVAQWDRGGDVGSGGLVFRGAG